jgi:hypothetical protein
MCWQAAEARVCREVGTKYREADEEAITILLCGELRQEFAEKNDNREFERTFASDLQNGFRFVDLNWVSHGLIGRVVHHPKQVEKRTGGDFGLVVGRPHVEHRFKTKVSMHSQGLLVQAKKTSKSGTLGKLTPNQRTVLPARLEYTAFLLYMYAARGAELAPFGWVCARGRPLPVVEADLARLNGAYPKSIADYQRILTSSVASSMDVIEALSKGTCGTSDQQVIDADICPSPASSVTIEITWRDGRPPDPPQQKLQHHSYLRQRL